MKNLIDSISSLKYKDTTFILNDELKNRLLFILTIKNDKQSSKED